jgi:hypothetical protein
MEAMDQSCGLDGRKAIGSSTMRSTKIGASTI